MYIKTVHVPRKIPLAPRSTFILVLSAIQLWLHGSSPEASTAVEQSQVTGLQDLLWGHWGSCCLFNCSAFTVMKSSKICADESQCFLRLSVLLRRWGKFLPPALSTEVWKQRMLLLRMHDKCLYIAAYLHN